MKFLLDRRAGRVIHFVDTERWPIHFDYAVDRLGVAPGIVSHQRFNDEEYKSPARRFELGSVVHYLDTGLHAFELMAGDTLDGAGIARLAEDLRAAIHVGSPLAFHPTTPDQRERVRAYSAGLRIVDDRELYRDLRYQPLVLGTAVGRLRFVPGAFDPSRARPDEILVFARLPEEVPAVRAIVSAELQAPLGHIAVLSTTRGTPDMALRLALEDPRIVALEGRFVVLEVGPQDFSIREARASDLASVAEPRRLGRLPSADTTSLALVEVVGARLEDGIRVGAKAAQLGEAAALPGITTPGGFVVPFAHYVRHLAASGAGARIDALVADPVTRDDVDARASALEGIRHAVEARPVDAALVADVHARIGRTSAGQRTIFRSSTNAEDLPGFTGAGLYRSVIVGPDPTLDDVDRALREVFASTYGAGAFAEREHFGIAHRDVAMAVLVQPFVSGALANGVAVTANPFYEGRPGFFVNLQARGGSVTGASGDELPEQHLLYVFRGFVEDEWMGESTRVEGGPLLDAGAADELARVLTVLHCHFRSRWRLSSLADAVDVEFLLVGPARDVVVLQARPYTIPEARGRTSGYVEPCYGIGVE